MAFAYSNLTHIITKKYLIDTQLLSTKLYLENGWKTVNFFSHKNTSISVLNSKNLVEISLRDNKRT
jgi:hypothetical protein